MLSIGIDLGTTYSCVAFARGGKAEVITNPNGGRTTPSHVAYQGKERLVGDEAKHDKASNRENTIYDAKRLIGRKFADKTVQEDLKKWAFDVVDDDGKIKIKVVYNDHERLYHPEEISSAVLSYMKTAAEEYLGEKVYSAVITVPAHFNDAQRRATRDAASIAGLHVLGMLNEPTAAAIAYGLENEITAERKVLIFDLGGGTFDVTVLLIEDQMYQVMATGGNTHLGGQDFNERLFTHLKAKFQEKNHVKLQGKAEHRLRDECEETKKMLSSKRVVKVYLEGLCGDDFECRVTRATFENLCQDLFKATFDTVKTVLTDAKLNKEEIDHVVLVGGSTRIPKIQQMLSDYFKESKICKTTNPDEAVAKGAALKAAFFAGDVASELRKVTLLDVLPLSLGVETEGGKMAVMIERNTKIPAEKHEILATAFDNQKSIEYPVYEGEHDMVSENHYLGSFTLNDLPALPAGKVKTEVSFKVDANGVLDVTARDLSKEGHENKITISWDGGRLSKQEMDQMVKKAEKFREEEQLKRDIMTARNDLEGSINDYKRVAEEKRQITTGPQRLKLKALSSLCDDTSTWMDENLNATMEEIKDMHDSLKKEFRPFE